MSARAMAMAQMRLPVPGPQSTRHWTNAIKGISPPGGGEEEGEEVMKRRLDDVIAALPEERRERVDARFEELKDEVESLGELRRPAGKPRQRLPRPSRSSSPLSRRSRNRPICICRHLELRRGDRGTTRPHRRLASRAPLRIERLGDVVAPNPPPHVVRKEPGGPTRPKATRRLNAPFRSKLRKGRWSRRRSQ